MTHFARFYSALFALLLLGAFSAPNSFASLKEREEEKQYVKPVKKMPPKKLEEKKNIKKKVRFPVLSLEEHQEKYGNLLLVSQQRKPLSSVQNVKQKLEWAKNPDRNFVIYPLVPAEDHIIFIKGQKGITKISLKGKKDVLFFTTFLGKATFAQGPSDTKIPVLKGFLTKGGKKTLTLGELRGK